jgi:hypothetical protein
MIAKPPGQNQPECSAFTEFYRDPAMDGRRQILPPAENLPLFTKNRPSFTKIAEKIPSS